MELDAYLRLNQAASGEWLHAIRDLLGCQAIDCDVDRSQSVVGSLSALHADAGTVSVLNTAQDMTLTGCRLPAALLVIPVQGRCDVTLGGGTQLPVFPLAMVPAGREFVLRTGEATTLILVSPLKGDIPRWPDRQLAETLAAEVHRFLFLSDYFRDHRDACRRAEALFARLDVALTSEADTEAALSPELDRRLVRVIEKIRNEPEWSFNLRELASHSGVSERNLYYLMKRETGLTPYRFYQRCRLIRVRRRLVDCTCDVPHISWYAADEGFSHLGRFAALYREHFGELPSETVQWRRALQARETSHRVPASAVAANA